jgi:hypothetical protein
MSIAVAPFWTGDFAKEVAGGLETAEEDSEARRHIIDLLNVQVTLALKGKR